MWKHDQAGSAGDNSLVLDREACESQVARGKNLQSGYDFIVCGSGSSGSVVASRLAEIPDAQVLLLEAGGTDHHLAVTNPAAWLHNIGSERDWAFQTRPNRQLNGRSLLWSMGKVLGGGSSINAMIWARGHRSDWDYFAAESGDQSWSYSEILKIYRRIEDWHGEPDAVRRGMGGPVFVQPAPDPNPIAPALLGAAQLIGIPKYPDSNGAVMESDGGAAITNLRIRNGERLSAFRTYVQPLLDRKSNLTVITNVLVSRVIIDNKRAVGVEIIAEGKTQSVKANCEVILSLGAIQTPRVLMQSGIGDENELRRHGIRVLQSLAGVGANLQEHLLMTGCVWEYRQPLEPRNNACEAVVFWKSDVMRPSPDIQVVQAELPLLTPELSHLNPPGGWSLLPAVLRPQSHGRIFLTGPNPIDPVDIDANLLAEPADLKAVVRCVHLCRELGNSEAFRPFVKREVAPGNLGGPALEDFVRNTIVPYWHQTGSAKMGRDSMSVVSGNLKVYGVEGLRIADGSVMPRVTTGNTMAPCIIIGERAGELVKRAYGMEGTADQDEAFSRAS